VVKGTGGAPEDVASTSVTYDGKATDAGDVLALRYIRVDDGNTARNFNVDVAKINGAAISSEVVLSVGKETLRKSVSMYPNPASSLLHIDVADNVELSAVQIIDVTGKVVYNAAYTKTINVASFAKGLYLLKLNANKTSITKKIIID
jgi:hypothetical protein